MTVTIGRRELLAALGGAAAAWPFAARAQQPAMPVIGFLSDGSLAPRINLVAAFRQGLSEAGYVDGQKMRRRELITLLGGAAAWPLAAHAQQTERVRRIGALMSAAIETDQQAGVTVFLDVLHQLGWIDGHNVRVEIRWARGDPAEARRAAEELVALPADVIMVTGQLGLEALLRVTHSVPIVFNSVIDPVGSGYVDSLARPGANA